MVQTPINVAEWEEFNSQIQAVIEALEPYQPEVALRLAQIKLIANRAIYSAAVELVGLYEESLHR